MMFPFCFYREYPTSARVEAQGGNEEKVNRLLSVGRPYRIRLGGSAVLEMPPPQLKERSGDETFEEES
jgi:hypothetical protein